MNSRILRQVKMILSFVILIASLVFVLKLVNWIPSLIDRESFRKFNSIESVRKELHIEKIYMPVYLPEDLNLGWPHQEIYAQKKPFTMIITHFQNRDSKGIGMIIHQVDASVNYMPESKIKFGKVKKESRILIKEREGILITGSCGNESICSQITWKEGDFVLIVTGKTSQRDIIRIAMSMIPEP